LNALEYGEQLAKRKGLYEAKYPQTKQGAKGGKGNVKRLANESEMISFSLDTATKIGKSPRSVEQDVQIANRIPETVRDAIRETPIADNKSELLTLSRQIFTQTVSGQLPKRETAVFFQNRKYLF
jgi:ParB family chromosome partitioning protein